MPPRRWQQFTVAAVVGVLAGWPIDLGAISLGQERALLIGNAVAFAFARAHRGAAHARVARRPHADGPRAHLPRARPPVLRPRPVPRARGAAPASRRPRHAPRVQHRVGSRGPARCCRWPSARSPGAKPQSSYKQRARRGVGRRSGSPSPACGATSCCPKTRSSAGAHGRRRHRHHAVRVAAAPRCDSRARIATSCWSTSRRRRPSSRSATSWRHPAFRSSCSRATAEGPAAALALGARRAARRRRAAAGRPRHRRAARLHLGPCRAHRRPRSRARAGPVDHDRRLQRLLTVGCAQESAGRAGSRTSNVVSPGIAVHSDRSGVRVDDRLRDREPEARAAGLACA